MSAPTDQRDGKDDSMPRDPDSVPEYTQQASFAEAGVQLSIKNPYGWMLNLRASDVEGIVAQLNDLWNGRIGARKDITNVALFSFNPAVIADMAEGRTAEQAMGYRPDEVAEDAYKALAAGATRQPTQAASGGSGGGGGGGGSAAKFDTKQGTDSLPDFFLDKLTRHDECPDCQGTEFWDNRPSKRSDKDPDFKCANRDCPGGKGRGFAVWEPDESRSRSGSSRTR